MSQPSFPNSGEAVFVTNAVVGVDDYGNDVRGDVATTIPGCVWWPKSSVETDIATQDTVDTAMELLIPPGTGLDPAATDSVILGGLTYTVTGDPFGWLQSPFTGSRAGVQIELKRVTG